MALTYKTLKKKHPRIYKRIQQEVHQFYRDLGVVVTTHYKRFELPISALTEGAIVTPPRLEVYYTVSILEEKV